MDETTTNPTTNESDEQQAASVASFSKGDVVHETAASIGSGGVQRSGVVLATHDADENNPAAVTVGWYDTQRVETEALKAGAAADASDDE